MQDGSVQLCFLPDASDDNSQVRRLPGYAVTGTGNHKMIFLDQLVK